MRGQGEDGEASKNQTVLLLFRISIELFDLFVSKCIGIDFVRLTKI